MEERALLYIHEHANGAFDAVFSLSNEMGTTPFCTMLALSATLFWVWRRNRREALLWVGLGLSTYVLQEGLKLLFDRPRPALWEGPVPMPESFSFPSGHAVAAATFYTLLARAIAIHFPDHARAAYIGGGIVAFYVGFGRLYLGVHWPTDVLAGWAIGAAQTLLAFWVVSRIEAARAARA